MEKEIIVYQVDATYCDDEGYGFSYSFYFMTPEPINTQFSRIINLICEHQNIPYVELSTNSFDVSIVQTSKVQYKYIKQSKMYKLIWNGEEIDTADTRQEAIYLQKEYQLAYGGVVTIKRK